MKQHHYLFISLVLGAVLGSCAHLYQDTNLIMFLTSNVFHPIGQIFLRLVFMVVVPMIVCGLFMGVCQLSAHRDLGKVISKTLLFTIITSLASVLIGISLVSIIKPGVNSIPLELLPMDSSQISAISQNAQQSKSLPEILVSMIPKNPFEAATKAFDGEMLSLMVFALIFGIAFSKNNKEVAEKSKLFALCEQIYETCLYIVLKAMNLAPIAIFSLIFVTTSKFGPQIILSLGSYIMVVLIALLIQQFGVYTIMLKLFTKFSPIDFYKKCRGVYLYAFATASSNATLPTALAVAEHNLKLNPAISRFVLTVGSTANQNGTALFEGVTVLFLAQVFSIDLSLSSQFLVVFMSILAGIGTAGVPGGSLPLIMILLGQVGIPAESIGLILGVDRILDMCRTTVNVSGDLVIAAVVDHQSSHSSKSS